MSKARLLFQLIMYANTRRSFTAQEVAHEFNISVRTAHRYLMELEEIGIPLYTETGRNGGYRVLDNRMLPPVIFNENEAFTIFFAFRSLEYYQSLPFEVDIRSVSRKLYSNLPPDTRSKIDKLEHVVSFWNKKRSIPSQHLKEILEAASENQVLSIKYLSKSENTVREVAPIGIYAYDGYWYMPAYDFLHNELRLFRTDRILSLKPTGRISGTPDIKLKEWLGSQSTRTPENPVRLYVQLTREGIRQCLSQPWLEPHVRITGNENGYIDMEIDRSELEFTSSFFLQLGTAAEVIEPRQVIDYILSAAKALLQHY